jgi:hypothetical protein
MPSHPKPCPKCGVITAEDGFSIDRSKAGGRKSHCKICDGQRAQAYYDAHRDELYAKREAVREAAWEAELKALERRHRRKVAAARKLHDAQVRRQKEFLRSIGVPDLSPEEIMARGSAE